MGVELEVSSAEEVLTQEPDIREILHRTMDEVVRQCLEVPGNSVVRERNVLVAWPRELFASGRIVLCLQLSDALEDRGYQRVRVAIADKGINAHFEW